MEHVAILKAGPLDKVLCGEKTIESRWLVHKTAPFNKIDNGDTIFLKRTSGLVEARASVIDVKQFEDLTLTTVHRIIKTYGAGIQLNNTNFRTWWNPAKKHCVLIFLENVTRITPFPIDKSGFGNMAAWLCLPDGIESVKCKS